MKVNEIVHSKTFIKQLKKLPVHLVIIATAKTQLFEKDPFHPSLRVHSLTGNLKGYWSLSVNDKYRILFSREKGGIIHFHFIGAHDLYKSQ